MTDTAHETEKDAASVAAAIRELQLPVVDEAPADADDEREIPFFPDFAIREAAVAFAFLGALVVLAALTVPELDQVGDPNSSGYVPRPEWYFLWLFEMLKYFPGDKEVIGTFFIPAGLLTLVIALPFLDRTRNPRTHQLMPGTRRVRVWPRAVGAFALIVILGLTLRGFRSTAPIKEPGPKLTAVQVAGRAFYERMGCPTCHAISGDGGNRGPDLTAFAAKPDAEQRVLLHFAGLSPEANSEMPVYQLAPDELRALSEYLLVER